MMLSLQVKEVLWIGWYHLVLQRPRLTGRAATSVQDEPKALPFSEMMLSLQIKGVLWIGWDNLTMQRPPLTGRATTCVPEGLRPPLSVKRCCHCMQKGYYG